MSAKNKTISHTGRVKAGYNPTGRQTKDVKTTPGSAGTNARGIHSKKRASLFIRKLK